MKKMSLIDTELINKIKHMNGTDTNNHVDSSISDSSINSTI